jgi:hypothetical protein
LSESGKQRKEDKRDSRLGKPNVALKLKRGCELLPNSGRKKPRIGYGHSLTHVSGQVNQISTNYGVGSGGPDQTFARDVPVATFTKASKVAIQSSHSPRSTTANAWFVEQHRTAIWACD